MIAALRIHRDDNVCVAARALTAGTTVRVDDVSFLVGERVPLGAKLALRDLAPGERIIKFGEPIGSATRRIRTGEHVHTHNMKSDYIPTFERGELTGRGPER